MAHAPKHLHDEIKAEFNDMMHAKTADDVLSKRRVFLAKWKLRCQRGRRQPWRSRRAPVHLPALPARAVALAQDHECHRTSARRVQAPDQDPVPPALRRAADALLVGLADTLARSRICSSPTPSNSRPLPNDLDRRTALYALPMARDATHVHVWQSLLKHACLTLARHSHRSGSLLVLLVRPGAARRAQGAGPRRHLGCRDAHVGGGSATHDDELLPVPARLRHALARPRPPAPGRRSRGAGGDHPGAATAYTAIWRKGCTPPNSTSWTNSSNNKAFLAQTVVMTVNTTLSIPGAAAYRAARRLLQERRHHRLARRRQRPAARDRMVSSRAPWSSRPAGTRRLPRTSSASSPRTAGSPTGWISPATASCRRCASWSSSRSGSTRATRIACARPSRS